MKIKIAEFRILPMEGKGLKEERDDLLNEMNTIVERTKESRSLSESDKQRVDEIRSRIKNIDDMLELLEEQRANNTIQAKTSNSENHNNDEDFRLLKDAILPNEKLEKRSYSKQDSYLDLGELVKVMAGKGSNNSRENKYYRSMATAGNKVLVPMSLSDRIIDYARNQSAVFGKIPIVQMQNNNLRIAVQTKDAQANFVNEGDLIPPSETIFAPVDLEGKTLAIFIPVSEQLLDSAQNLSQQLVYSCSQALSVALDRAILYGKGVALEESEDTDEIKGIFNYDSINKISHTVNADYDAIIKGLKSVKQNNIMPTDICYSSTVASELAMLKDSTGQYITEPRILSDYNKSESNNIKDTDILVYDYNALLLGIHKGITIEWGYTTDMFQRIQKGLRLYVRADLGVVRPKGISAVTITEQKKEQD